MDEPGCRVTGGRGVRGPIEASWMPDFSSVRESGPTSRGEAPARVQRASG